MADKKMVLKSSKKKKKLTKIKLMFYLSLIYISFSYTFYYSLNLRKTISNEEFINLLVTSGNANILNDYKVTNVVNKIMDIIFDIDFTNPSSLLNSSILKFGTKEEEVKTISLEYNDDYSNMEELEKVSDYIKDPNPTNLDNPIIYLYNSHQLENYNNKDLTIYGITPNVLMASYVLKEKLNEIGISTIVEETNMSEILSRNNWNYSYSYQASRSLLEQAKNKHSTLKYFIDIHRDSVTHEYSTITINGTSYAKIMFVIGLDHKGWESNYKLATSINEILNQNYPGISRGIMKKEGANVNGIYNQDFSPNCLLLEIGGVDNTIEEVYNTMNALANILSIYMKGDN